MMGSNMQKLLDKATAANGEWVDLKGRDETRAAASLTKQSLLETETVDGVLRARVPQPKAAAKPASKKADKAEKAPSKMVRATILAFDNPTITRQDFMKMLQEDPQLSMSKAGANTYSSAAMKKAKALRDAGNEPEGREQNGEPQA